MGLKGRGSGLGCWINRIMLFGSFQNKQTSYRPVLLVGAKLSVYVLFYCCFFLTLIIVVISPSLSLKSEGGIGFAWRKFTHNP